MAPSRRDRRRKSEKKHKDQEERRPTPPTSPVRHVAVPRHPGSAIQAARSELFSTIRQRRNRNEPKVAALNIAAAQRLVLADLQHDIAQSTSHVLKHDRYDVHISLLGARIRQYCEALRDLEYMQQCAALYPDDDERDPFYLKSSKTLQRQAMEDAGLIPDFMEPKGTHGLPQTRDNPLYPVLPGTARSVANEAADSERLIVRFLMATLGGLALILPMLVMTFFPGKIVSVVTTSVAMLIFAALITLGTQLAPDQVLGATAAYAAVLVVFVGTSLTVPS